VIGADVAHYRIVAKLGEGGMGAVYKAFDTRLERFVALKTISTARPLTEQRRLRLIREAKAASALNHPNIVTIYDVLTDDSQFFIAMEYVEGSTLKELVSDGRLPLAYAVQISGALAKTHVAGVVHRDLKPPMSWSPPTDRSSCSILAWRSWRRSPKPPPMRPRRWV